MKMQTLALAAMVTTAIGGVAYVFIYPLLSGERKAEQRRATIAQPEPVARKTSRIQQRSRREQVEDTLKDIDLKQKRSKNPPLQIKIEQAGLTWSKNKFLMIAGALGLFAFLGVWIMSGLPLPALGAGFAAGFGLPLWMLSFLKKRREKKFLAGFPDAVDVIVRGSGSGREQAIRAIQASGIEVKSIMDDSPVPHNGCRPKKKFRA